MHFDVFFSISQTPVGRITPTERDMFLHFFDQVRAADECGFETAWVAESHLSTEVQKSHARPVVPHWQGEIGLNADITQLAHKVFACTRQIEVGSAVTNLLVNGGPIAAAERLASFATLHGLDPIEHRRLRVGFAQGRFDFMNRCFGVRPRSEAEDLLWPLYKGRIFREASQIFLRLVRGETLASEDINVPALQRAECKDLRAWSAAARSLGLSENAELLPYEKWYTFESVRIIPQDYRRDLIDLIVGSHDAIIQEELNRFGPVKVFNLSITQPDVIEDTHARMQRAYHPEGGPWKREFMPRTVMVFLNDEDGYTPEEQQTHAESEAREALSAYWNALEGTVDPEKLNSAAANAVIGNVESVTSQLRERFHPDDRLMLWFDFFNHNSPRVLRNMNAFARKIMPILQ